MTNNNSKSFEQQLMEEKNLLEAIISSMGEGLLVVGLDYRVQMINPAAETLFNVAKKEVVGKSWIDVVSAYEGNKEIPVEDRTSIVVMRTGKTIITKLEDNHFYKTQSGRYFPVVSITAPIKTADKIKGAVKVFRDATFEREAKEELQRKINELERLNKLMVGRELKMVELKEKLKENK